jgi:hypothetical protein
LKQEKLHNITAIVPEQDSYASVAGYDLALSTSWSGNIYQELAEGSIYNIKYELGDQVKFLPTVPVNTGNLVLQ